MEDTHLARPQFLEDDNLTVTQEWYNRYTFLVSHPKFGQHIYTPNPKQVDFHESNALYCIMEGTRGTGKSLAIRNDAHMRALACPGMTYLVIRRTMPELKKTHLRFIRAEMQKLGGYYHGTDNIAYYPNGSQGFYSQCDSEEDMLKLLSSEYAVIYFDELTTFTGEQITKIATCARVPEDSGLTALIRGGTNPLGVGAEYVMKYYITKDVVPEEDDEYLPEDYVAIHTVMGDNPRIDEKKYRKKFSSLPEHVRRAWLDGEWVMEGAYFMDFRPEKDGKPWHVVKVLPKVDDGGRFTSIFDTPWIRVYRTVDWGFFPDPAVCLWIAILPNGREIVFAEDDWTQTTAKDVAASIKSQSPDGMRIAETFCDPTMYANQAATDHSVGDIFEMNGVPLTKSTNNRITAGYAIHEHLNMILDDGLPKIQIYAPGCPRLVKTFPTLRIDKHNPKKIADGNDHWVIALAYYCMALTGASKAPLVAARRAWQKPKKGTRTVLGSGSVRRNRARTTLS